MYADISFSGIKVADFRCHARLSKIVIDESQKATVDDSKIIWLLMSKESDVPIHTQTMPVKSPPRVYDTQNVYKRKTVSYG